jgi:alpha-galactosidase
VKVFIMMGQSNMLGMAPKGTLPPSGKGKNTLAQAVTAGKYPYLYDKATKNWTVSKTVRNVFVMGSGGPSSTITLQHNEFMTAAMTTPAAVPGMTSKNKKTIGPELGIGGMLEAAFSDDQIMMLKSCIGDRALGWDLLPTGTKGWTYNNQTCRFSWTPFATHSPSTLDQLTICGNTWSR